MDYLWCSLILLSFPYINARPENHQWKNSWLEDELEEKLMHPVHLLSKRDLQSWADHETENSFWYQGAQDTLKKRLNNKINTNIAKNIIFYLGDGMSVPTLFAARTYQGQLEGKAGEEGELYWETFPYTGISKTWCIDGQVPDSACTSTAYMTGVKSKTGTIGLNGNVVRGKCETQNDKENHVHSFLKWAQDKNKSIGIVTTTRITHASPAGGYAHVAERYWESDREIIDDGYDPNECMDIAKQLITQYPGKEFKVILGGGRKKFLPKHKNGDNSTFINNNDDNRGDDENETDDVYRGQRKDGLDLIKMWEENKKNRSSRYLYLHNRAALIDVMKHSDNYDYLLGLFDSSHLPYHLEADPEVNPTLSEMTEAAIKVLRKDNEGFILFVEGGRIDHAHHGTYATLALDETVELAKAVKVGREMTSVEDTLVITTSDHGHTMSAAGYSHRGAKINGINSKIASDQLGYTTLSYANGPGYKINEDSGKRYDISEDNIDDVRYQFASTVPLEKETHGGEDVMIFASGPWAHLFTGTIQQSDMPHLLAYASCLSPKSACNDTE